jgi:hypothetical protein
MAIQRARPADINRRIMCRSRCDPRASAPIIIGSRDSAPFWALAQLYLRFYCDLPAYAPGIWLPLFSASLAGTLGMFFSHAHTAFGILRSSCLLQHISTWLILYLNGPLRKPRRVALGLSEMASELDSTMGIWLVSLFVATMYV